MSLKNNRLLTFFFLEISSKILFSEIRLTNGIFLNKRNIRRKNENKVQIFCIPVRLMQDFP